MESVKESSAVPAVTVNGLSVRMQDVPVLEDVSLEIPTGEFLAILGPNGSGKTTLLKAMNGLLKPDQGQVRLFGVPVGSLGRRRIGYLPQSGAMNSRFPISAAEVVMMGRYAGIGPGRFAGRSDRTAVSEALERVGATEFAQTPLGRLSGGQRQRVFLARALVNKAELLLLDEPTTAMDTDAVENFYDLLQSLHREGTTIVIVSHDVGVVSTYVDRVACLNRRLVAHGRPDDVMSEEILEEMYGCHSVFLAHGSSPHMVVREH